MGEDNWYSQEGEQEQIPEEGAREPFENNTFGQSIYKEGSHQQQGEYRDVEADFRKPEYQQDTWQQSYQPPYQEQYQPVSQGFGIASLAIGIVSLVLFCSCINIPLAILAIVFGIIQLTKPDSKKGMAVGGIVTAAISLISFVVFCIFVWGSVDFQEGFRRGLQRSLESQMEDGYLNDYEFWNEDSDRLWDGGDDELWDDEDHFEDEIMDTF